MQKRSGVGLVLVAIPSGAVRPTCSWRCCSSTAQPFYYRMEGGEEGSQVAGAVVPERFSSSGSYATCMSPSYPSPVTKPQLLSCSLLCQPRPGHVSCPLLLPCGGRSPAACRGRLGGTRARFLSWHNLPASFCGFCFSIQRANIMLNCWCSPIMLSWT